MKTTYFLLISSLISAACASKDKTETILESNAVDTLSAESPNYEKLSTGDWFTAKCELLCDEEQGKFLDIEKLKKYGQHNPYGIKKKDKQDSVIVSFDVIADCCMDFAGGVQIKNDTLILEYQPPHDSLAYGCDCSCDYRMIYRINKKDKHWVDLKTKYKRRF
jgi:hypothetical protein